MTSPSRTSSRGASDRTLVHLPTLTRGTAVSPTSLAAPLNSASSRASTGFSPTGSTRSARQRAARRWCRTTSSMVGASLTGICAATTRGYVLRAFGRVWPDRGCSTSTVIRSCRSTGGTGAWSPTCTSTAISTMTHSCSCRTTTRRIVCHALSLGCLALC